MIEHINYITEDSMHTVLALVARVKWLVPRFHEVLPHSVQNFIEFLVQVSHCHHPGAVADGAGALRDAKAGHDELERMGPLTRHRHASTGEQNIEQPYVHAEHE